MPRSNSNHRALSIHIVFLCTLLLTGLFIGRFTYAQDQNEAENTPPQSAQQEDTQSEPPQASSPMVDLINSSQNKKSQMHSMDWDNKKYKKKVAKEKTPEEGEAVDEAADEAKTEESQTTQGTEEELTEESQKIWKHYHDLAERVKEKKSEEKKDPKKADKSEVEKEEKTDEAKKEDKKETQDEDKTSSSGGITEILQRYKETQKSQGPMNSRSFGSID